MINIFYIHIGEDISQESYDKLLGVCGTDRHEAISKYRLEADRKRTVYGEALAKFMISKKTGILPQDIQVGRNPYGKPYATNQDEICYNISHSGNYVVCGLDTYEIGVDIEEVREIDQAIAKSFFHSKEYEFILSQEINQQIHTLYDFWTLKESYIKYLGVGLHKPLNSFYFILDGPSVQLVEQDHYPAYFYCDQIQDNYKLAVCVSRPEPIHVEPISLQEIVAYIEGAG